MKSSRLKLADGANNQSKQLRGKNISQTNIRSKAAAATGLVGAMALSLGACAAGPSGSSTTSWKEEVVLHDGQKVIVERSQTYGGRHEIGQSVPEKEHTIRFMLPNSNTTISWTSEYGEELGRANFNLLALHIMQGTPYLVAEPNLCLSYNKWGRPNPPYVFFAYNGKEWQRIAIADLPSEFKTINLIVNNSRLMEIEEASRGSGFVPAAAIVKINENLRPPALKTILREPLSVRSINAMCEKRVLYKGSWILPNDPIARQFIDSQK